MAGERVVLTWNFTNWITVVLMAVIGLVLFRLIFEAVGRASKREG